METQSASLIVWSLGVAASGYLLFAIYLLSLGKKWRQGLRIQAMLVVILLSTTWAGLGSAYALTGNSLLFLASVLADLLRYGGWYVFLIFLLTQDKPGQQRYLIAPLFIPACWGAIIGGVVLQLAIGFGLLAAEQWARTALFQSLLMNVLGLMLIEQLFRNVSEDSRWNIKPLCLGLGGIFAYDLYLYSDALMFNRVDIDAFAARGFVNTLVIPLLAMSTLRSRDWTSKIRLSQKAAFHSATLLIAGIYLLFMAGIGYYVRYFGGDWGRAFQLGILFAGLLGLGFLVVWLDASQASCSGGQAFFQLPLRLPRRMVAVYPNLIYSGFAKSYGSTSYSWLGRYG